MQTGPKELTITEAAHSRYVLKTDSLYKYKDTDYRCINIYLSTSMYLLYMHSIENISIHTHIQIIKIYFCKSINIHLTDRGLVVIKTV